MPDPLSKPSSPGSAEPLEDRLDSWKEIAAYLGRGIRTVQRWEREEGLPVHRLLHEKRGSIYARRTELAAWWESRRQTLAAQPAREADEAPAAPRLDRVTRTSAMTTWPALSSDARLIAYVSDGGQDGTTPQIWMQQIGGAALRLTIGDREYSNLSFSADDTHVVFTAADDSGRHVYEVPTLGGEPHLLQRDASIGRFSPDGQWLACVPRTGAGIRIAAHGGVGFRTIAADLIDVASLTWLLNSRAVLVHARPGPTADADWWIAPMDGAPSTNTALARSFLQAGMVVLPTGAAWVGDFLVFSAAGRQGICLYRQRIAPATFEPTGAPEPLTTGNEAALFPTAAAGRLAFLSSRQDANLWSVSLDAASGIAHGPLRRLTRGPGIMGYLSTTSDYRTLAYFSVRQGEGDVFLRDLASGTETFLGTGPGPEKWYPAISPSGTQVAYGHRMPGGERAPRPIFIARPSDSTWRTLGEDCHGRPRQWVDERFLIIERFAHLNSIALIDTTTADQRDLLQSTDRSISNPRLSPDRQWIAFDASRPRESASVLVAPFRLDAIPDTEWIVIEQAASHPFWSADGRLLYYTPMGANAFFRSAVRARRFESTTGRAQGEPIGAYASIEMVMPAYLPGTAPIATPDRIFLVLGDFTGDVWLMHL
jgi:Tol biopolymer transport system component